MNRNNRIELIDLIRGTALLGILLMNIRLFSQPYAVYFNPLAYGDYQGLNKLWWDLQYIVADQKFMAIFSMLFGASTALVCDQYAKKELNCVVIFGRRMAVLFVIGLIHSYLIWHGDILVSYSICSLVPFLLRNTHWRVSLMVGISCLVIGSAISYSSYLSISSLPNHVQAQIAQTFWSPNSSALGAEIVAFRGDWIDQFTARIYMAFHFQTESFINWGLWRISGLMLLGVSAYRSGLLTGQFRLTRYTQIGVISGILGLILISLGYYFNNVENWTFAASFFKNNLWNYWGSVLLALSYICLLAIIIKKQYLNYLTGHLRNIGRTALSNYLLQSLMCTGIVYGFNLFARLDAIQSASLVLSVWLTQTMMTHYWLKYNAMGPVERIWRKLTLA